MAGGPVTMTPDERVLVEIVREAYKQGQRDAFLEAARTVARFPTFDTIEHQGHSVWSFRAAVTDELVALSKVPSPVPSVLTEDHFHGR